MKLCRFNEGRIGIVSGEKIVDITDVATPLVAAQPGQGDPFVRALPAIRALAPAALQSGKTFSRDHITMLSPVMRPGKIVAAPVNYRAHAAEANADPGIVFGHTQTEIGEAGLFLKATSSLVGESAGVTLRFPERRTDYELELVIVIGKEGSDIPASRALEHVAGYSIGLDMTLRGPEDRSFRKSIDSYSVLGPWLVTADEVANPDDLTLTLEQNGARRQHASTRDLVFGVARLIEFASSFYTLHPGDLIFTGTPEGVGRVAPGDRLVGTIEPLGQLRTTVRAPESSKGSEN